MDKLHEASISRETEKALLVNVHLINTVGDDVYRELWFPKSQVEVTAEGIFAASWLCVKKQQEINDYRPGSRNIIVRNIN